MGGQVLTSNTHQQIDFLRGCRREEGGGRRAVTDCDGYTMDWTIHFIIYSPADFSTTEQTEILTMFMFGVMVVVSSI